MTWPPGWIQDALRSPLAFAQVREDALLDLYVVEQLCSRQVEVMMIASGGCTAAALAASNRVSHLHIVDVNPAQIALTQLKLHLLQTATPKERAELLGHLPLDFIERFKRLLYALDALKLMPDLPNDLWGVELGLDHAGRYEILFAELRRQLRHSHKEFLHLVSLHNPAEQSRLIAPETPLGQQLDAAFDSVMALPNLIALFGESATRNSHEPFSHHFARRTRLALATLPAATNPYLWQMLLGRFSK